MELSYTAGGNSTCLCFAKVFLTKWGIYLYPDPVVLFLDTFSRDNLIHERPGLESYSTFIYSISIVERIQ
jgi:hypothetical protein